jgi:hypothetical protein
MLRILLKTLVMRNNYSILIVLLVQEDFCHVSVTISLK